MTSSRRKLLLNFKKHGTAQNRRINVSCAWMTAYWTGTEIGQLGGYGFKGVTLGVVGSCKD